MPTCVSTSILLKNYFMFKIFYAVVNQISDMKRRTKNTLKVKILNIKLVLIGTIIKDKPNKNIS